MPKFIEKQFKTILNKYKMIDNWFWVRYSINPYNGCQFGCIYCDSRSSKYHLPENFDQEIIVKTNVGEMLDKRISNARTLLPDVVGTGGTTDCYQPAEKKFENTKQILEVLKKHNYPVLVGTKSTLVLRDLELLDEIGNNSWASVCLTITSINPEKSKFLEKQAPSPSERFNVIKIIKEKTKNIQTGVWLIPIIPYFTDTREELEALIIQAKDTGADFILFGSGVTMRDRSALWFLKHIKNEYPDLIPKFQNLYNFDYDENFYNGNYEPSHEYLKHINIIMIELCTKHNMPYRMKRYIPEDYRKHNYILAEKLLDKSFDLQIQEKNWKIFYWAGHNIQNLTESLTDIAKRGELRKIRNIGEKLEKRILNYLSENGEI